MQKQNYFKGGIKFALSTIWKITRFSRNRAWKKKWVYEQDCRAHPVSLTCENRVRCLTSKCFILYLTSKCPKRQKIFRTLMVVSSSSSTYTGLCTTTSHPLAQLMLGTSWWLWQIKDAVGHGVARAITWDFVQRLQTTECTPGKQRHTTVLILPATHVNNFAS